MSTHSVKKLGSFLCWAIVFADIGTSLYYVPGILYGDVGKLSGLFVLLSSLVFVLLVLKYIDITDRYAEGGGVVTVATSAFGPWIGALGGIFISLDYFLTAAISSVSGFAYLSSRFSALIPYIILATVIALVFLGILNVIGIKESAGITAVIAVAALVVDIIAIIFVATQIGPEGWNKVLSSFSGVGNISFGELLTGFAGSFLAFSGLESISQLSPAMQTPRRKVTTIAMLMVVITFFATSPALTLFSTNLLDSKTENGESILESVELVKTREFQLETETDPTTRAQLTKQIAEGKHYSESFISELGATYGGDILKTAVVATASVLLIFAANTAMIGAYHVFITLSRNKFLPKFIEHHNHKFGTPHFAVLLAVLPPILIVIFTKGDVGMLGSLYPFGLLGAFAISSLGLDIVRWRESRKFSINFILGLLTTFLVVVAWVVYLITKPQASAMGATAIVVCMIGIFFIYRYNNSHLEADIHISLANLAKWPKGQILLPVFGELDPHIFEYASKLAKVQHKQILVTYIREFTDILQTVSEDIEKDSEAEKFLQQVELLMHKFKTDYKLYYTAGGNIGDVINDLRSQIKPSLTIVSPHFQSQLIDFLKGNTMRTVLEFVNGDVLIYTGQNYGSGNTATKRKTSGTKVASLLASHNG